MTIKQILDNDWQINIEKDIEFEFRAAVQDLHWQAQEKLSKLNELKEQSTFQNVHQDIKQEGLAWINALEQFVQFCDAHSEFSQWSQP